MALPSVLNKNYILQKKDLKRDIIDACIMLVERDHVGGLHVVRRMILKGMLKSKVIRWGIDVVALVIFGEE